MTNRYTYTIFQKEFMQIRSDKTIFALLIILPAIFAVLFPTLILIVASTKTNLASILPSQVLSRLIPSEFINQFSSMNVAILHCIFNYLLYPFFLLIPVTVANITASEAFVGEKEHRTLEGLLSTPISISELILGKLLGSVVPAIAISWGAIMIYALILWLGGQWILGEGILLNANWLILGLLLAPSITVLSVLLVFAVCPWIKTAKAAQSVAIILVLPIMAMLISQVSGILLINKNLLFILFCILILLDLCLFFVLTQKFDAEKYIL